MAMTKKERPAMDRAETLAALRWTSPVQRDVDIPKDGYSQGWDYNAFTQKVFTGWSSAVSHGTGAAPGAGSFKTGSQQPQRYYSTEALALAAMRHEIEQKAAADLLKIDRQIAALDTSVAETA